MMDGRIVQGKYWVWQEWNRVCPICQSIYTISSFPTDWKEPYYLDVPVKHYAKTCGKYECNMEYLRRTVGYRQLEKDESTEHWLAETKFREVIK